MFCCKSTASFSLPHDPQTVIARQSRGGSRRSVVSTQPKAKSENADGETKGKDDDDSKTTSKSEEDNSTTDGNPARRSSSDSGEDYVQAKQDGRRGRIGLRAQPVDTTIEIPKHPKSPQVADIIKKAILDNQFLNDLIPKDIIDKVVSAMAPMDVTPLQKIIKQGEHGETFYVNETGSYQVIVNHELYTEFHKTRVFGELAVLYNQRRAATVQATTAGRIWMIDAAVYKAIMIIDARQQEELRLNFLRNVKILSNCSLDKLRQITKLLKPNFYPTNTVIVKQGDVGDKFFLIKAGKVTVTKDNIQVANLKESDYFGEKALLGETDLRQATCIAVAPGVTCLELSRQEFRDYLGDFEEFMHETTAAPQRAIEPRRSSANDDEEYPHLDQLTKETIIGEGGFGRVLLTKETNGSRYFALKMLGKFDNNSPEQKQHVINEKNIQKNCRKCNFVVRLYTTFTDDRYLYFLMEPCMGGDLFAHMQRQDKRCFDEDGARFISGCILEALAFLHERNYIYRDLKPENMLIDYYGYIKLADFGFAKAIDPSRLTFTFAGTPEYVAPEVIYSKGHNRGVDYWAFGIFIFELLAGKTPFKSNDPSYMATYGLIMKGMDNIMFPKQIGKQASNLIKRLCRLTPHERLGCQKGGVDDIRKHKWYQSFDWKKLQRREIESKFKPQLKDPFDTQFFDDFDDEYPEPKRDDSNWDEFVS